VSKATKPPGRKLDLDRSERCVGPRAGLDQPIDQRTLFQPFSALGFNDDIGDKTGSRRPRKLKPVRQPIETVLAFRIEQ
jgi:hypothetical protein